MTRTSTTVAVETLSSRRCHPTRPMPGWRAVLELLVLACACVTHAQVAVRPVSASGGCPAGCIIQTDFSTAEGWTQDASQWQTGGTPSNSTMSVTFGGIDGTRQTGFSNNEVGHASGGTQNQGSDVVIAAADLDGNGRGYRHYRGGGGDNNNGGGMNVQFAGSSSEVQFSYKFRYAAGYGNVPGYTKDVYWVDRGGRVVIPGYQGGGFGFNTLGANNYGSTVTWTRLYGGTISDGKTHCIEYYFNTATSRGIVWFDGVKVLDSRAINYGAFSGFNFFHWGSNQTNVATVTRRPPSYTDYDHLRVAVTGLTAGVPMTCS